jgi:hypothetical protein
MSDPEYTSTTLAYECRDCGRAMRARGVDGRCVHCIEPPPVRCERCHRVRHGAGQDWFDHPGSFAQELAGMCATCQDEKHKEARRGYFRGVRQTVRRQQHKEPWAPGTTPADVWKGFREGDR